MAKSEARGAYSGGAYIKKACKRLSTYTNSLSSFFIQKEIAEQKLLHLQLREEATNEFRSIYRKNGSRDKDINQLKFQNRISTKKMTFDMENLKWEMSNLSGGRSSVIRRAKSADAAELSNGITADMLSEYGGDNSMLRHL